MEIKPGLLSAGLGANFRLGSAAPNTLRIPKAGAALQRDFRHIPDTTIPNAQMEFHVRGVDSRHRDLKGSVIPLPPAHPAHPEENPGE